jgi:hypothetical protein
MYEWRQQLEEAGYVNIQERVLKVPIGGWPKDRRLKEAGVFELETLRVRLRPKYQGHLLILIVNFAYRGTGRFTGYRPWLLHTCAEMEGRGS